MGLCLAGFVSAIRLTSLLDMGMLRNTYVTSLARFTMLHAPANMQQKSAKAFRSMLFIAEDNGNHLHVRPQSACYPRSPCARRAECGSAFLTSLFFFQQHQPKSLCP